MKCIRVSTRGKHRGHRNPYYGGKNFGYVIPHRNGAEPTVVLPTGEYLNTAEPLPRKYKYLAPLVKQAKRLTNRNNKRKIARNKRKTAHHRHEMK